MFGAWSLCAPACICMVCLIRACFHAFPLILAVFTGSSASLDTTPHFRTYSHVTPELDTYPILGIVELFFVLVKRWSLESQEDTRYY